MATGIEMNPLKVDKKSEGFCSSDEFKNQLENLDMQKIENNMVSSETNVEKIDLEYTNKQKEQNENSIVNKEYAIISHAKNGIGEEISKIQEQTIPAAITVTYTDVDKKIAANAIITKTTNSSLDLLAQYTSSSEDENGYKYDGEEESSADEAESERNATKQLFNTVFQQNKYRAVSTDDDSTNTESDSDVEFIREQHNEVIHIHDDADELEIVYGEIQNNMSVDQSDEFAEPIKAKGELGIEDLPPIEDLAITVSENECIKCGTISGVVETLVLVESIANFAAMDIDTVLFLDKGNRTLGQVFDVMGNVSNPIYCVRFNSKAAIEAKGLNPGIDVYVAPNTAHTNFIVLTELMKQKGCDASWKDDVEPPSGFIEFSDDEEEQRAKYTERHKKRSMQSERLRTNSETSNTSSSSMQNKRPVITVNKRQNPNRQQQNRHNQNGNKFYTDNRDYATLEPSQCSNGFTPSNFQNGYSWHTATLQRHQPSPSTHSTYLTAPRSTIYPNPYAPIINSSHMATAGTAPNVFNSKSFPPLPPPMMNTSTNKQYHRSRQHFGQRNN